MIQPGDSLGPYTIVRELGRGGMGVVFEARHAELQRRVALKVLFSHVAEPEAARRFALEAQAAGKLRHPHVVSVHDAGEADGVHYMAMDLIEGESLSDRIRRTGPLPPAEALRVAKAMAQAMAHAHGKGILHRDLKPSNVMVDPQGHPYLTDFGLAKLEGPTDAALTRSQDVLGTPSFMSPEQADGRAKHGDVRMDVYGLGATLFALLTARPPFEATSAISLLSKVLTKPPPDPSSLQPGIPPDLERIVLRSLAKDPAQRPASMDALLKELEACSLEPASQSSTGLVVGALFCLLALILGAGGLALAATWSTPEEPPPSEAPVATTTVTEPPVEPDAPLTPTPLAWSRRSPETSPPPRFFAAMAWDPRVKKLILHGGQDWWVKDEEEGKTREHALRDTWAWDGVTWSLLDSEGPALTNHRMTYDEHTQRLLTFGGASEHTGKRYIVKHWAQAWEGDRWETLELALGGPAALQAFGMTYDRASRAVVITGGRSAHKTRHYTWRLHADLSWERCGDAEPWSHQRPSLAYDAKRGGVLRYGGLPQRNRARDPGFETLPWDQFEGPGARIARLTPDGWIDAGLPPTPRARYLSNLIATHAGLILLGGRTKGKTRLDDCWILREETWERVPCDMKLHYPSVAYDAERKAVVAFGGALGGQARAETWVLELGD